METISTATQVGTTAKPTVTHSSSKTDLNATAPGQLRVIKRNGTVVPYEADKINIAITKAFLAVEGGTAAASSRIHDLVRVHTEQITDIFNRRMPSGGTVHIEDIQDQVELSLMRSGEHKIARSYVLYREEHARLRNTQDTTETPNNIVNIQVTLADGQQAPLDVRHITSITKEACEDLTGVDHDTVLKEAYKNLYQGVSLEDVNTALVIAARTLVEQEPNYTYVTARLLLDKLRNEALQFLDLQTDTLQGITQATMATRYPAALKQFIDKGIELELLSPELNTFDLDCLGQALDATRDLKFTYLGLQTLYDRYFIHTDNIRFELPQIFFMRVAMGLSINETDKNAKAIEFYNLLSSFDYMSSTPTLFNSGTLQAQLSSCYLTTVPDDLFGIYQAIQENALLSKWAGGLGNDWTPVRALGAHIKGTNGKSQGVVPFLKVVNDTAVAVNQGGKRKGAVCAYLETWHLDIEEFLDLRKNTGDDRRRTHDMNTANWVPDLFMKRVFQDEMWTLFSPNDVADLHECYGTEFEKRYTDYEALAQSGGLKHFKQVRALDLWRKMLTMLYETGHPWITFKDSCNLRSPQQHVGVVHSSNLCTEITLNTGPDEIAVCNLGSVNLANHINENGLDTEKLKRTVKTAIRMLDNVIDINYYAVEKARNSNLRHRPIGLGLMGFQDALYKLRIPYSSPQAVSFADQTMEAISYYAIEASCELSTERGAYDSFQGSLWSQGILPIHSIEHIIKQRGQDYINMDTQSTMDWDSLTEKVVKNGMRNSNVMAIAPTATISNITGVTQSIEPTYQNLFVKSNLSGEFTVVNPYLVHDLKARGLWDSVMVNDLKYYDGSALAINRIPDDLKALYATAFEIEPKWLIEAASRRQKWIDQAQSLNIYISQASGKKLDVIYRMAWYLGLKTTYYLRSLAATGTEKSTVSTSTLNAVQAGNSNDLALSVTDDALGEPAPVPKACSIDDPDCEACQ